MSDDSLLGTTATLVTDGSAADVSSTFSWIQG